MGSLTPQVMADSLKQVGGVVVAIIALTILLELVLYFIFEKTLKYKYALPIMLLSPAVIGLTLLFIYPILYEFRLAFSNMSLDNFKRSYNITDTVIAKFQEAGMSADAIMEMKGLTDQVFTSEDDMLQELTAALGADVVQQHKDAFLQNADRKDGVLRITKRTLFTLKKSLPEEIVTKLQENKGMLNSIYTSERQFLRDAEQALGNETFAKYKDVLLQQSLANAGPSFGWQQGLQNFREIFTSPVLKQIHFMPLFLRTILWTAIQVFFHTTLGLGLAMLMNNNIKFKGIYRTLIIIPWAVPQIIAVLAWRGEFHSQYGFINIILGYLGIAGIEWKSNPFWNYVAMNIVNIWLGVPFMMVILLGGLQSIPITYYEAAEVDGATRWHKFRNITLPLIQPVMTPAVILGVIWTFNNFNVPYMINEYELESSDILVTALFRSAFEYNRYGFAAAFALIIFLILLAFCMVYMRIVKLDLGLGGKRKKAAA
ncbi:transporter [Candidatus Moduliflexus flocculans]|uniref:Maltose/maltodextrin transport system permease protein n=1 Tax=Candidatus Moduliflexus flocculans TaxID=1499966 RepID=A0A0S6VQ29_9BACT|nr:transporter [Candidatus Moduliflexus flocculans]